MRSLLLIGTASGLVATALSTFAQTPAQGPSTAAFPSDSATPSPAPSAPPAAPPPSAAPAPSAPASAPAAEPPPVPAATSAAPAPPPPASSPPPAMPEGAFAPGMAVPPPGQGENVFSTVPVIEPIWPPRLVQSPGWFGGIEGYAGILALGASDTREAYAFLGGQLRLRYDYYELGGYFEASDQQDDEFQAFGGFLGAWLPFRGWVDFEIAAAAGVRNYNSTDTRYGVSGYEVSSPTLGLRLGVSDRTSSYSAFAGRIGGQILFNYDLNPSDEAWREELERDGVPVTQTGNTRVGGYTVALALVLGFDYGKPIKSNLVASRSPR